MLLEEFRWLRAAGIKTDAFLLEQWALRLLDDEECEIRRVDVDKFTNKAAEEVIYRAFIRDLFQHYSIVNRVRTGKKQLTAAQVQRSNREMSVHVGKVKRAFDDGLNESDLRTTTKQISA